MSDIKKSVMNFLEVFGVLRSIQKSCIFYSQAVTQVLYPFDVFVNTLDLMEFDSHLCNMILEETVLSHNLFKEVIFEIINSRHWLPKLENIGQLIVTIRIINLPPFPEFRITKRRHILSYKSQQHYQLDGMVIAHTTLSSYTRGAVYRCSNSFCPGAVGYKFIRVHIPGAQEWQTVRDDFKCNLCNTTLEEDVMTRLLSEKIIVEILPADYVKPLEEGYANRSIAVYIRGELVKAIKIGHFYSVVVLLLGSSSILAKKPCLEANFITPYKPLYEQPFDCYRLSILSKINEIRRLLDCSEVTKSPHILPHILSYYFGDGIVTAGLFYKLKLGILLALATCGENIAKRNMTFIVIGDDTIVINRLLMFGCTLAPKFTTLTESEQLKVVIKKDKSRCGVIVEGNELLLAAGGVCFLGDLSKFSTSTKRTITTMLENNVVMLENLNENLPQLDVPLKPYISECQMWGYLNYSSSLSQKVTIAGGKVHKDPTNHMLNLLNIAYYTNSIRSSEDQQKENMLVGETFATAMKIGNGSTKFAYSEMKAFLENVQQQKVHFDKDAECVIQQYYVASRRVRNSLDNKNISISSIATLTLLAEAYAKISLRRNVTEDDAIAAVLLYEEYLTLRYGPSCFNVQPILHLTRNNICMDLKMIIDQHKAFGLHLKNFISLYGKDTSWDEPEE